MARTQAYGAGRRRATLLFLLLVMLAALAEALPHSRRSGMRVARRGVAGLLAAATGASLLVHLHTSLQGLHHNAPAAIAAQDPRRAAHRSTLEVDRSNGPAFPEAWGGSDISGEAHYWQLQQATQVSGLPSRSGSPTASPGDGSTNGTDLPSLFLFIGILSGQGQEERRAAVREAWANRAQQPGTVVSKFVLSDYERTAAVDAELERYGDIIFVSQKTDYSTILHKTYHILEYAVQQYNAAFILKTDDDTFVNVPALLAMLRTLCRQPGCRGERLYLGSELRGAEVVRELGHRWNNEAFVNHTGLEVYPSFMPGGGYVVSADVAAALVDTHRSHIPLKHTTAEDATMAMWLLPLDLRRIDHPRFLTRAERCCVAEVERKRYIRYRSKQTGPTVPAPTLEDNLALPAEIEAHLCGPNPWLVLHKVDPPSHMRYLGQRVRACTAAPAGAAAAAPLAAAA